MLAAIGDVVDDIVVRVAAPIRAATDTAAAIARRRGGSAANVAVAAAGVAGRSRFLGQVGDDATADLLLGELHTAGVDTEFVRRAGRTGSIIVLVDVGGERTFLTDPGSARRYDHPAPAWLDDVDVLHVPFYSLADEPIATTVRTLARWAADRHIPVTVDVSSVSVLEAYGLNAARDAVGRLAPAAVFANADEAAVLGIDGPLAGALTFVKDGPRPATVHVPGGAAISVPAQPVPAVSDTTGAGDAFAAGVLTHRGWRVDPADAARAGHTAAASLLRGRGA